LAANAVVNNDIKKFTEIFEDSKSYWDVNMKLFQSAEEMFYKLRFELRCYSSTEEKKAGDLLSELQLAKIPPIIIPALVELLFLKNKKTFCNMIVSRNTSQKKEADISRKKAEELFEKWVVFVHGENLETENKTQKKRPEVNENTSFTTMTDSVSSRIREAYGSENSQDYPEEIWSKEIRNIICMKVLKKEEKEEKEKKEYLETIVTMYEKYRLGPRQLADILVDIPTNNDEEFALLQHIAHYVIVGRNGTLEDVLLITKECKERIKKEKKKR